MKKTSISVSLILLWPVLAFVGCQQKVSNGDQRLVFQEGEVSAILTDSAQVQNQFSLELNVGEESERGSWQNPELVIRKLGNLRNKTVADIGSGTGYFTFPISRTASKVLAIDIEQRYLDYIEDRKLELPIQQANVIETRLTVENEPNLHADEVDAVLLVNVYYYLEDKTNYMAIVNNALRDDGILVLVDFKPGDLPVGPSGVKPPAEEVVEILKISGFDDIEVDEASLEYQYIITAK